jgi:hypothetical protein
MNKNKYMYIAVLWYVDGGFVVNLYRPYTRYYSLSVGIVKCNIQFNSMECLKEDINDCSEEWDIYEPEVPGTLLKIQQHRKKLYASRRRKKIKSKG